MLSKWGNMICSFIELTLCLSDYNHDIVPVEKNSKLQYLLEFSNIYTYSVNLNNGYFDWEINSHFKKLNIFFTYCTRRIEFKIAMFIGIWEYTYNTYSVNLNKFI